MTVQRWQHDKKLMPCRECGRDVEVGVRTQNAPRCYECGLKAAVDAARQMKLKAGPYYERWLQSRARAGLPPPRPTPPVCPTCGGRLKS